MDHGNNRDLDLPSPIVPCPSGVRTFVRTTVSGPIPHSHHRLLPSVTKEVINYGEGTSLPFSIPDVSVSLSHQLVKRSFESVLVRSYKSGSSGPMVSDFTIPVFHFPCLLVRHKQNTLKTSLPKRFPPFFFNKKNFVSTSSPTKRIPVSSGKWLLNNSIFYG